MNYRERLIRAFPVWKQFLKRPTPMFRQLVVDGGAAGPIAVAGIKAGDQLCSVSHYTPATSLADITAEFVLNTDPGQIIRVDGYIDNTDGTATTSDNLLVAWISWV